MANQKSGKKSRRTAWLLALGLSVTLLVGGLTGALVSVSAAEERTTIANGANVMLDTTYATGTEYTLPTDIYITEAGEEYKAGVILRDPDGNGYTAETVTLALAGRYTVEYRAKTEAGKLLMARESFSCLDPLFAVSSPRSTAGYVEVTSLHEGISGGAGIGLSVAKNDRFEYNQILDITNATKDDKLISFYVTPEVLYNYDAGQINFVLTDAYDASNSVTITVKRTLLISVADMQHYTYVTANASTQPPTAINLPVQAQYPAVTVDGERYSLHVSNAYGRSIRHSMYGGYESDAASYLGKPMSLSFDYETRRVYAWAIDAQEPVLVADLDDPAMFDNLWEGFTDGKVVLSVSMSSYRTLTSNLVITKIGDDDLTKEFARDNLKPSITVDLKGYSEGALPKARLNQAYPIFPATASDETDGSVLTDVSVWYNYASEETRVRISSDGKTFTPTMQGTYTIVYSAEDRSGNITNQIYNVEALALDALELSFAAGESSSPAGRQYSFTGVTLSGGSGEKVLKVSAALDSDPSVVYELKDGGEGSYSFVPLHTGKYTVTFTISDWLEEKTESYSLNVTKAEGAYIADEAAVPRYVLTGGTYEIPALTGYTFEGGPALKACEVSVEGGTVKGNTFLVTAESGTVTITYKLEMSGGEAAVKTYELPVVAGTGIDGAAGSLDMSKFFVQSSDSSAPEAYTRKSVNFSLTSNDYNGRLLASVTNTDESMAYGAFDFVNKVLASRLQTEFAISQTGFMRVVILVTDSVDPAKQVKLTYANGGSWKVNFSVNDGYSYATSYTGSSTISLVYNSDAKSFTTNTNITAPVATYLSGEPFEGFTSGYVYLTYRIEGVYASTGAAQVGAIQLNRINNQTISGTKSDNIDPEVTAYVSKGDLAVGTLTEIPAFLVCDVLNPYATISVVVNAPDGTAVTSVDGVLLDGTQDISRAYEIELTQYGSYTIGVNGKVGASGSAFMTQYGIQVLDMTPPEVTFIEPVSSAKVGDVVPFAGIHVSDNVTAAEDILITAYLMTPNGRMTEIDLATYGSFTASEAGEYRFIIYACDAGNTYGGRLVRNTAIVWYCITVTE